jgi:hypothetical protein
MALHSVQTRSNGGRRNERPAILRPVEDCCCIPGHVGGLVCLPGAFLFAEYASWERGWGPTTGFGAAIVFLGAQHICSAVMLVAANGVVGSACPFCRLCVRSRLVQMKALPGGCGASRRARLRSPQAVSVVLLWSRAQEQRQSRFPLSWVSSSMPVSCGAACCCAGCPSPSRLSVAAAEHPTLQNGLPRRRIASCTLLPAATNSRRASRRSSEPHTATSRPVERGSP